MRLRVLLGLLAVTPLLLANEGGCDVQENPSDQKMNRAQEQLSAEAASSVGMPAIRNFQEKRMLKNVLELRDQAIATQTYMVTLDGRLVKVCDSIGYGIPYATQYTNPQKVGYAAHEYGVATLPQADPNGLFSPAQADGTWVQCLDPASKRTKVVYIEPHVIVSPFPLTLVPVP